MLKKHLRRPSPSMAVALVALLFALSGNAIASGPIASITKLLGLNSKQKSQVTSIANTQISTKASGLHVSYAATAGSAGTATNATHATSATNATSAYSALNSTNASYAAQASELQGIVYIENPAVDNPSGATTGAIADCPAGTVAVGGGAAAQGGAGNGQSIESSFPLSVGTNLFGWQVYMDNRGATDQDFDVFVACAPGTMVPVLNYSTR